MIDERRKKNLLATENCGPCDLLSILMTNEFFAQNDDLIIDELLTFFLAGMKTI